jgi:hypothetical protein
MKENTVATRQITVALGAVAISLGVSSAASAKSATFLFNNSLAAQEAGIPSLVSVDPLGGNGFETATVEGQSRAVFKWDGNRTPIDQQAGLLFDSSFLADPTSYTVEMVFEFTEDTGTWRRIIDTTGRMADTGFYVEPGDRLQVYNDVTGSANFTTNEFHRIALTVGNNSVKAYFDGNLELNSPTDKLNIVDPIVSFFVDNNLGGPAQTEFADGRIAYLRISDGVLSDDQIADNADNPIDDGGTVTPPPAVPLPAAALMFLPAAGIGLAAVRRSRKATT